MLRILKYTMALVATLGILLFISCEDQVLNLAPYHQFTDNTAYTTPERCELAVIGAYAAAQMGRYSPSVGYARGYPFGAASILQGEMRGEDMVNVAAFYDYTYSGTYSTVTANNVAYWNTSFEAINRYNVVKAGIEEARDEGLFGESIANNYIAEMLFLRAMTYSSLMTHFAYPVNVTGNNNYGLPLYTKAIRTNADIDESLLIGRSTVAETYGQIIADLNEAERLFDYDTRHPVNGISRASKGTVIALKTRVYLHMREWDKVIEEAKKLVPNTVNPVSPIGAFALMASPDAPFRQYTNNTESIWSCENSVDRNGSVNGSMAQMMSIDARRLVMCSPILYNDARWLPDDKRRDMLVYYNSAQFYMTNKYQDWEGQAEWAPIIRYPEVILNYAEAELRQNDDMAKAVALLNVVRNRSLADPATQAYTVADFSGKAELMEAILFERRVEFHAEGRRWEDIHRLANDDLIPSGGIPAKIDYTNTANKGAFVVGKEIDNAWFSTSRPFRPYTDYRFLWPIPSDDLIRNPTLKTQQNAGWDN